MSTTKMAPVIAAKPKLACEMMDPEVRAVSTELLRSHCELDQLEERTGRGVRL